VGSVGLGGPIENETVRSAARLVERADPLLVLGSALDINPYASTIMGIARHRVPYVLVSRRQSRFDDDAVLAIDGEPSVILALAPDASGTPTQALIAALARPSPSSWPLRPMPPRPFLLPRASCRGNTVTVHSHAPAAIARPRAHDDPQ